MAAFRVALCKMPRPEPVAAAKRDGDQIGEDFRSNRSPRPRLAQKMRCGRPSLAWHPNESDCAPGGRFDERKAGAENRDKFALLPF
jgi:hypothetical protein